MRDTPSDRLAIPGARRPDRHETRILGSRKPARVAAPSIRRESRNWPPLRAPQPQCNRLMMAGDGNGA